jgi:hypothetical protein
MPSPPTRSWSTPWGERRQLARGFGVGISTPDSEDFDELLVSIVPQMPVRLVQ